MNEPASLPPWTPSDPLVPAHVPTMYFVGVTTHQSSINRIFPKWIDHLRLDNVSLRGMNFQLHDKPEHYRRAVEFIRDDPLSLGALITTHKLDLLDATKDLFTGFDEFANTMNEVSGISKSNGRLFGHATDPIAGGLALEAILPDDFWQETGAEALVLGAGGSSIAITWYLLHKKHGKNRPSKIIVTNRSTPRLLEIQRLHESFGADIPVEYHLTREPKITDELLGQLKPGSLIANATGLGKDAPGSPLTDDADWPQDGIAWDFNYRGDLVFLDQARAQQELKSLRIEDGWIYFIHGWTRVMAAVLNVEIPASGERFDELSRIAAEYR